jgi:hypothetical protein
MDSVRVLIVDDQGPSPTGVCRMGSPRTTAATVDPVGAIPLSNPGDTATREPHPLNEATSLTADPAQCVLEHGPTVLI